MTNEKRQQILIISAVAAVVLLAGDSFVLEPLLKSWSDRSKSIEALKQKVQRGTSLLRRQVVLRDEWEGMRTNTLPSDKPSAESQVSYALDGWAKESGAALAGIKPTWKNDDEHYTTVDFRVDASGNLEQISKFLYHIETSPMALKMNSVEVTAHDTAGQQLTIALEINGLRLNAPQQ
jgi:Tfp pilus assembly protein PilO